MGVGSIWANPTPPNPNPLYTPTLSPNGKLNWAVMRKMCVQSALPSYHSAPSARLEEEKEEGRGNKRREGGREFLPQTRILSRELFSFFQTGKKTSKQPGGPATLGRGETVSSWLLNSALFPIISSLFLSFLLYGYLPLILWSVQGGSVPHLLSQR